MKHVLVVDDVADTTEVVQLVLESNGFKVTVFNVAKDALKFLEGKNLPDIILLDMRMPIMSGPEFADVVSADDRLKNVKVVFFTASSDLDRGLLKKHHVNGFIFKPFDNDKLVSDVKNFLKK